MAVRAGLGLAAALLVACDATESLIAVWAPEAAAPAFYFEAESGALSGPLEVGSGSDASNGRFITASEPADPADGPGSARASYDFEIARPADYLIWARIHAPSAGENRFWIRVDDADWFLWRISTGETWYWDDFHDDTDYGTPRVFRFEAGSHRLEVSNAVTGAELDRFYVTALGDRPPGDTTPCDPPHSIEIGARCQRSCGSFGDVSCDPAVCAGLPDLGAYDCGVCCLPN